MLHNLREHGSGLFGRDALLTTLQTELADARLVTLTGPGGVGKSRIAHALAETCDSHWVDLASLLDGAFVPSTIAAACDIPEQHGVAWLQTLSEALSARHALLVLDNCEHVRPACDELCATLLATCPHLKILATSRLPLRTPGGLRLPVPLLEPSAAQTLFAARAAARVPDFTLDAVTGPLVRRICEQLDGLPLAIELAAARLPLLTVAQIAERLAQSLPLLAARSEAGLPRQRSLRATLDWSCALLADAEVALFRRLAVFAGTFDLDAVEAVCRLPEALDLLSALLDAALVTITARDEAGATRYRLHEVVRQYAAERLALSGDAEACAARHVAWAIALAERAACGLVDEQQATWLARLALDHENLRAALLAAEQADDADSMLRLATVLTPYWNAGVIGEGRGWLERALRVAGDCRTPLTASAWNSTSFLAYRQGDYAAMRQAAETALDQGLALEEAHTIAEASYRLGIHDEMQERLPEARTQYEHSLELYRQLGDRRGVLNVLNGMAHVARLANDGVAARGFYEQGLELARATNDRHSAMLLLISLGNLLLDKDWEHAEPVFAESLAHLRALGATSYLPYVSNGLGQIALLRGDLATAEAHFAEGLEVSRTLKLDDQAAQLLFRLGDVAIESGDLDRAVPMMSESLQTYVQLDRAPRIVGAIYYCAKLIGRRGYPPQAVTLWTAGMHAAGVTDLSDIGGPEGERLIAACAAARAALTPAACAAAEAEGRTLTLQQAAGLALSAVHLPQRVGRAQPPALQIFTLGTLRVLIHGRELTGEEWVYSKTRELLVYLLYTDAASKEQIGAALWPDASQRQLRHNFRMAIYHLRRALGDSHWITFAGGRYAFNRALGAWHDGAAFGEALARAAGDPANRVVHLQRAMDLYVGDLVLDALDSDELLLRREQLRQQALDALLRLGALHLAAGDCAAAGIAYRRAIALDSYLEAAHRGLLRALARAGDRAAALAHFQTLYTLLQRDLAATPDPATHALADAIKRGAALDAL